MNHFLILMRTTLTVAAFAISLSGCSGGGLAGEIITGRVVGGEDEHKATIQVSSATTRVDAEGGEISVEISNTGEGRMNWSASLDTTWASIEGETTGAGQDTLTIVFEANTDTNERTVTLSITSREASNSPRTVTFAQAPAEPEPLPILNASADNYSVNANGSVIAVDLVNEGEGELDWSATLPSEAKWVRFIGKNAGRGASTIQIEVDANSTRERRSFELIVTAEGAEQSPQTLHFSQEPGNGPAPESIVISADSYDLDSNGGTVRVAVTADTTLQWTASIGGNADWVHFSGPSTGTGNGNITIRIDSNAQPETRSFELTVRTTGDSAASQTLSFVQEAADTAVISLSADPADRSLPHTGGTVRVDISNSGGGRLNWTATTDAGWASVAGTASGTGAGSVVISVLQNGGEARAFTVTVQAAGASNTPRTIRFTQDAAPERPRDSARISANKYALSHLGETVTVNINVSGGAQLNWNANILRADSTYVVVVPELGEEGNPTGRSIQETRDRGEWVRILGNSSGTGSGSLQLQVDRNPVSLRWSFSLSVRFPDAPELDQTLHFGQDYEIEQRLTLWTASRHIGAGGETVEVHLSSSSGDLVYWIAEVDTEWAHLEGAIDGKIDGNGAAVIRVRVDANTGEERSFNFTVSATDAQVPPPLTFRQAMAREAEDGDPAPPPPPVWYSNECQRLTPGFEEFGGWLAERGHYLRVSDSRVWRHISDGHESNEPALRAFTDCTEDSRTLTTNILADASLDEPAEFANLPVGHNTRIVLLDTVIPSVGAHMNGARHEDPEHVWSDSGSGWYPTFTKNGSGAKFLHLQPLGDWGYESSSGWNSQVQAWNAEGSDMSAWTDTARGYGWRLPSIQERTGEGLRMLANADTSLWLLVGGYTGSGAGRRIHPNSAVCGDARELCLFAPWEYQYTDSEGVLQVASGTTVAAAQVAAALDNVLVLWPDYDLLELRDLVLGCAEDLGDEGPDTMWGRGVLSFNCLFTAQGDLRDPRTNTILSGGIYGPLQGLGNLSGPAPAPSGASILGIDRTSREFNYPVLRWSYHENDALLAATGTPRHLPGRSDSDALRNRKATLLQTGSFTAQIAAAGGAFGAVAQWRGSGFLTGSGGWTLSGGIALQQEGAGSLRGERVFRAPATLSSAFSIKFRHNFSPRLALRFHGNYWMTLDTIQRSLWTGARLSEFRVSAAIAYESGGFEAIMQAQYGGGLAGQLDVAGRAIRLTPSSARQLSLRVRVPFRTP